ncbi:hypothetical protein CEE44_02660 [Candidatus Woesearchaeota archaeon B3_Woes]|nr:MAG: hypothetical protein CEE44_02660 [Candidatus Woesearchaeota archaeon B3_Woes]
MQNDKDKIIDLIRQKGPCLPSDIYRDLNTNMLFASAMLGELVSNNILKVTYLKRASSPYYYLEEQKEKLQNISNFLNEKDKASYDLIKEKKILKDTEQSPLTQVALRAIKDYAVPLQINHQNQQILFWKWYMLSNQEAEEQIKLKIGIKKQESKKKEIKKPTQIKETKPKQQIHSTSQTSFLEQTVRYFKKNNITIINQEMKNTKKTEIDFVIELPSAVGTLQYYCKAKNKKKINDADIASAFVQGQQKKLPVILLITGEMTKKSKEMLNKEFKGLKIHQI